MQAANNPGGMTKKQAKKMKKLIDQLQQELAEEVLAIMRDKGEPMEMTAIVEAYPDNERRRSCRNMQELKQYVAMGLGKLIHEGQVRELPKTNDGRFLLEVV